MAGRSAKIAISCIFVFWGRAQCIIHSQRDQRLERRAGLDESFASEQQGQNLCVDGRLYPEFFLLGVQKSATTTFASIFYQSPSIADTPKEISVFYNSEQFNATGYDGWLNMYPACRQDVRFIGADSTPILDSEFARSKIKAWYGPLSTRITFAFILRAPVPRMFSAYCHAVRDGWSDGRYRTMSFEQVAEKACSGEFDYLFETSKYEQQIKQWFEAFSPSQFFVMMFKDVDSLSALSTPEKSPYYALWAMLGLQVPSGGPQFIAANTFEHMSLQTAISTPALHKLKNEMYKFASPEGVANQLFVEPSEPRPRLWGCESCNSVEEVAAWIKEHWGETNLSATTELE